MLSLLWTIISSLLFYFYLSNFLGALQVINKSADVKKLWSEYAKAYVEKCLDEFVNSSRRVRQNIKRFCTKLIDVSADFSKYKESDERIRKQYCGSMSYCFLIHLKDKNIILLFKTFFLCGLLLCFLCCRFEYLNLW